MKQRITIAFDASPMLVNKTGVAYYIERLVTNLAAAYPDDIELVGFYYNFLGRKSVRHFPDAPNIRYRPVRLLPSKIIYQLRRWGIELPVECFTKERSDFILFGNFLGYPSIYRTPAAPVVHDLTYVDLPEYVSAKNQRDLEQFVPRQIARSAFVITVSDFTRQKIMQAYTLPAERVLVTPIPPEPVVPVPDEQSSIALQQLGITKPFILFLGTIEPRKNIVQLIDAYAQLPDTVRAAYSLVIAGRIGWNCAAEVARLKAAAEQGLDVIHVGYIDDTQKTILYQSAAVFSSASYYEGFGMPVLEAMSHNTPCAVSDIPVFHEVAGDAVRYFDQNNPGAIAEVLQAILEDPDAAADLRAKAAVQLQQYSWPKVAQSVHDMIRAHLERGKA